MMDEIPSQDGTLDSTLPLETKFEETRVQYEQKINRATNAPIQRVKKRGKKLNQDKQKQWNHALKTTRVAQQRTPANVSFSNNLPPNSQKQNRRDHAHVNLSELIPTSTNRTQAQLSRNRAQKRQNIQRGPQHVDHTGQEDCAMQVDSVAEPDCWFARFNMLPRNMKATLQRLYY